MIILHITLLISINSATDYLTTAEQPNTLKQLDSDIDFIDVKVVNQLNINVLYGNNHCIKNLHMNQLLNNDSKQLLYNSLFNHQDSKVTIQNICFQNVSFKKNTLGISQNYQIQMSLLFNSINASNLMIQNIQIQDLHVNLMCNQQIVDFSIITNQLKPQDLKISIINMSLKEIKINVNNIKNKANIAFLTNYLDYNCSKLIYTQSNLNINDQFSILNTIQLINFINNLNQQNCSDIISPLLKQVENEDFNFTTEQDEIQATNNITDQNNQTNTSKEFMQANSSSLQKDLDKPNNQTQQNNEDQEHTEHNSQNLNNTLIINSSNTEQKEIANTSKQENQTNNIKETLQEQYKQNTIQNQTENISNNTNSTVMSESNGTTPQNDSNNVIKKIDILKLIGKYQQNSSQFDFMPTLSLTQILIIILIILGLYIVKIKLQLLNHNQNENQYDQYKVEKINYINKLSRVINQ